MTLNVKKALREGKIATGLSSIVVLGLATMIGAGAWYQANHGFNKGLKQAQRTITSLYDDGAISETIRDGLIVSLPTPRDNGLPLYLTILGSLAVAGGRIRDNIVQRRYEREPSSSAPSLS